MVIIASLIRELAKSAKDKQNTRSGIFSADNILLYGNSGKSTMVAGLSTLLTEPILILSPAGASNHLNSEYDNIITYNINDLNELENIVQDLERNFELIRKLQIFILTNAQNEIKALKDIFIKGAGKNGEEDFNYAFELAKENKYPIGAICLEEMDVVSSWIQDRVEKIFEVDVLGENKKNLSQDWNELKKDLIQFYSRLLKLPIKTIFATSEKLPKESQLLTQIVPSICVGAANRLLLNMIGNCFYSFADGDKYQVRISPNKDVFIKNKFKPVRTINKIEEVLDVTGKPEYLWTYLENLRNGKIENKK